MGPCEEAKATPRASTIWRLALPFTSAGIFSAFVWATNSAMASVGPTDTNQVIVSQNEFKRFIAPSTLSSQRPHPRPRLLSNQIASWRPLRSLREKQSFPICLSSVKFNYVWLGSFSFLAPRPKDQLEGRTFQ